VNDVQRYFVEEFVEEYHEGHMSRREMMRRVLLITGGVASAATTLLTLGCGKDSGTSGATNATAAPAATAARAETPQATAVAAATPPATAVPPAGARGAATMPPPAVSTDPIVREDDPTIRAEMVQFPGPAGQVFGYLARPRSGPAVPGVIVIHENRGLLEPNMDIARRFAKEGFAALAVDLVSRQGGTAKFASDPAQIPAILGRIPQADHVADMAAGIAYLKTVEGVRREGFGVGGGMAFALAMGSPEVRAAVPFYGSTRPEELAKTQAAVLAFYGEADTRITAQAPAVEQALRGAGRTVETRVEPGAGHAFFNNAARSYNADAARNAWPRMLEWFARYLNA